jgi:G3E family GTPase
LSPFPDVGATRHPPPPFPLTVITGFLGAGKTTLLNRLIKDPSLSDTLVIINEFGEIGLDHLLVERVENDMILMSSGCICCTIRGDLVSTLEDVLRRRDNGRCAPFNRVIIETTGLADPAPILQTIMYHPYLLMRFRLEAVITLVDAVNGEATLDNHEEALKQAAVADSIVLTKADILDSPLRTLSLARLRERLTLLNPSARQLDADKGEASAENLLNAGVFDTAQKAPDVRKWLNAEAFDNPHHAHAHSHDPNRHDDRIRAFCLTREKMMPQSGFSLFLELLRQAHGPKLLRVKGIVCLEGDPDRPIVIHGVQHVFHPPTRLEKWPDADRRTRIVFILRDLEPSFVEGLWQAFTGEVSIDRPDASALANNPLKPSPGGLLE